MTAVTRRVHDLLPPPLMLPPLRTRAWRGGSTLPAGLQAVLSLVMRPLARRGEHGAESSSDGAQPSEQRTPGGRNPPRLHVPEPSGAEPRGHHRDADSHVYQEAEVRSLPHTTHPTRQQVSALSLACGRGGLLGC